MHGPVLQPGVTIAVGVEAAPGRRGHGEHAELGLEFLCDEARTRYPFTGDRRTADWIALETESQLRRDALRPRPRVILQALKRYGMILAGTGDTALSFADDRLSVAKRSALGITATTFETLRVGDFEVVALCAEVPLTGDCVRVR